MASNKLVPCHTMKIAQLSLSCPTKRAKFAQENKKNSTPGTQNNSSEAAPKPPQPVWSAGRRYSVSREASLRKDVSSPLTQHKRNPQHVKWLPGTEEEAAVETQA